MIATIERPCRSAERLGRLARALRLALWTAGALLALSSLALIAARTLGWPWEALWGWAPALFGATASLTGVLLFGRRPLAEAALALDRFYDLKTRLSSSLALAPVAASGGPGGDFAEALIRETAPRAATLRPGAVVSWRLKPSAALAIFAAFLLGLATFYYPVLDVLGRREAARRLEAERDVRRAEARRLEDLARELRPKLPTPLIAAAPLDVSRELERLTDSLRNPTMDRADAMLRVSNLNEKLKNEREKLSAKSSNISPSVLKQLKTPEARALARAIMSRRFDEASALARDLAEAVGEQRFLEQHRRDLGEDLGNMAEATDRRGELSDRLRSSGEAVQRDDSAAGRDELQSLADALDELARIAESRRRLSRASEALERAQRSLGRAGLSPAGEAEPRAGSGTDSAQQAARTDPSADPAPDDERRVSGRSDSEPSVSETGGSDSASPGRDSAAEMDPGAGTSSQDSAASDGSSSDSPSGSASSSADRQASGNQQGGSSDQASRGEQGAQDSRGQPWGELPPEGLESGNQQSGSGGGRQSPDSGAEQGDGGEQGQEGQAGQQGGGQGQGLGEQGARSGGAQGGGQSGGAGEGARAAGGGGRAARNFGAGSTNLDQGAYEAGSDSGSRERQSTADRARWEEEFMRLYAERSLQTKTFDTRVSGQYGRGADIGSRRVDAEVRPQTLHAPTAQLFLQTQRREKQSLDYQDIPLDYKDAVRSYFDSIEDDRR